MKKRKFEVRTLYQSVTVWTGTSKRLAKKIAKRHSLTQGIEESFGFQDVTRVKSPIVHDWLFETGCSFRLGLPDNDWINPESVKKFKKY